MWTIPVGVWSGSNSQVGNYCLETMDYVARLVSIGYPWWPCMVDYCPEVEETFLIDVETNPNEAAQYHVV